MGMEMHEKRENIDYDESISRRGTSLKKTHYTIAVFYVLALLLNSRSLHENAKLMRFGRMRDACISLIKPIAETTPTRWLAIPREKLEALIYRD